MRKSGWILGLTLLLSAAACGPARPPPVSAFEGRLSDWTREILADSPELASQAGVAPAQVGGPYNNRLDDRSEAALEARRSAAIRRYVQLRAIDTAALDTGQKLTYEILREQFEGASDSAAFDYGSFFPVGDGAGAQPYVLNQMSSAFVTLPSFLDQRASVRSIPDAQAYIQRLHQVAVAIDQETRRAQQDAQRGVRPPLFIMDETIAALDGVRNTAPAAQPYFTSFQQKLDAFVTSQPEARRLALQQEVQSLLAQAQAIVRDEIIPAHERAASFLRADRANATDAAGVWRLPHGQEFYAAALKLQTTTDLTPQQIHQIGLDRVHDLNEQLDIALRRVGLTAGTVGQRLSQMTRDPRYAYPNTDEGRAQLMHDVQARLGRMLQLAPQWFGHLPRARFEVRRVPVFAEAGSSGAYYSAPSLDGSSPGIYFVNLRDLSEMTKIDLPTQDFHEAIPGHHFQISLAQELRDVPLLRRLISFNAYTEGWGLYAEQLADEEGSYDNDPVGRIGYLRWQLWRAARLVVDTGIHAGRWTRQQAIDYLTQTTGDAAGVIATEVDRYIVMPGQACGYELGRREIVRLREDARNTLGPDFDLRGFHDAVLLHGELPLNVLDQVVQDWIPEQRRIAERERRRR
ncbi:MAG: DUF885 domain-containing protein [Proteobacteria bacterium]|nr:DUF885 domain-containing protein [Pseudomonadota bacterium]